LLAITGWTSTYALELTGTDLNDKIFWAKAQYLFIITVPFAWLVFSTQYTGRTSSLAPVRLALLLSLPLLTLGLVWTNEIHHLVWKDLALDLSHPFPLLAIAHGPFFSIHTAYSYFIFLVGLAVLGYSTINSPHFYRSQGLVVIIGGLAPFVGNAIL
jgi:hypothetical protein